MCLRGCGGMGPAAASIGFVCSARLPSGERCPSARPSDSVKDRPAMREMTYIYTGGKGKEDLKGVLDLLCGYAHAAGVVDHDHR